jgi:acylphosphatase
MAHFTKTMPTHRRICYFGGRVQGVGFRYTAQNIAMQYDVSGYVRNLPDGRVELVMEGPDPQMNEIVDEVRRRMEGFVREVKQNESPATGEFDGFFIRH